MSERAWDIATGLVIIGLAVFTFGMPMWWTLWRASIMPCVDDVANDGCWSAEHHLVHEQGRDLCRCEVQP